VTVRILQGDALAVLKTLPDKSVHCVITSPPYWGLRAYLPEDHPDKALELGLEAAPAEYIAKLVAVFAEVRRVLRPDGTVWLNLGDWLRDGRGKGRRSWWRRARRTMEGQPRHPHRLQFGQGGLHIAAMGPTTQPSRMPLPGLKLKDLVGTPWASPWRFRPHSTTGPFVER
jgi:hypothetical protein